MRILFVDDESRRMEPIVEEFKFAHHEVVFQTSVDPALKLLEDDRQQFDLVVIDVSMPSGAAFQGDDTYGGTRTGLFFYDALRKLRPRLKVVVFTNVADRLVEEHFKEESQELCRFIRKPSVLPFQFVEEVERFWRGKNT